MLIKSIKLDDLEKNILKYLMFGFTFKDIADGLYEKERKIKSIFNNICKSLHYEYKYRKKEWLHCNIEIKIKDNEKFKRCGRCDRDLNILEFDKRSAKKTQLQSFCRNCDKEKKRQRWKKTQKIMYKNLISI